MPVWAIQLIIAVAMLAVSYAITPRPPSPKPPAAGQAELPSADEGGPLPVVFGVVTIKQLSVLASYGLRTKAIREKVG